MWWYMAFICCAWQHLSVPAVGSPEVIICSRLSPTLTTLESTAAFQSCLWSCLSSAITLTLYSITNTLYLKYFNYHITPLSLPQASVIIHLTAFTPLKAHCMPTLLYLHRKWVEFSSVDKDKNCIPSGYFTCKKAISWLQIKCLVIIIAKNIIIAEKVCEV